MRRIVLATLVLIPVLAHGQASTSTGSKPSPAAATLVAKATPPATKPGIASAPQPKLHETVKERVEAFYLDTPTSGSDTYLLVNDEQGQDAPKLIHVVETNLSAELVTKPVEVSVRVQVDAQGMPENIAIDHSAGSVIDQKTIEAVNQFRFKPATVNHVPVTSEVDVDIKIQKQ